MESIDVVFTRIGTTNLPNEFSLSLRERAGVGGNRSCEDQRCATFPTAARAWIRISDVGHLVAPLSRCRSGSGFGFRPSDFCLGRRPSLECLDLIERLAP